MQAIAYPEASAARDSGSLDVKPSVTGNGSSSGSSGGNTNAGGNGATEPSSADWDSKAMTMSRLMDAQNQGYAAMNMMHPTLLNNAAAAANSQLMYQQMLSRNAMMAPQLLMAQQLQNLQYAAAVAAVAANASFYQQQQQQQQQQQHPSSPQQSLPSPSLPVTGPVSMFSGWPSAPALHANLPITAQSYQFLQQQQQQLQQQQQQHQLQQNQQTSSATHSPPISPASSPNTSVAGSATKARRTGHNIVSTTTASLTGAEAQNATKKQRKARATPAGKQPPKRESLTPPAHLSAAVALSTVLDSQLTPGSSHLTSPSRSEDSLGSLSHTADAPSMDQTPSPVKHDHQHSIKEEHLLGAKEDHHLAGAGAAAAAAGGTARPDKQFTCKICSRSFGYKHVLQNHERTHTGEKPFECPECHKRFTRDHHLKTHMRLHTGEKPYHCDHCDRHFVQVANLRRHMRVHTGEKPYKCEICKCTFADSNQLKGHKALHSEDRPYACAGCPERFKRSQQLKLHCCAGQTAAPTTTGTPTAKATATPTTATAAAAAMAAIGSGLASPPSSTDELTLSPSGRSAMSCDRSDASSVVSDSHMSVTDEPSAKAKETKQQQRQQHQQHQQRQQQLIQLANPYGMLMNGTPCKQLPVQTEPEDLSMNSPRTSVVSAAHSPVPASEKRPTALSVSASAVDVDADNDDDLDDLDDAAALYLKHKERLLQLSQQLSEQ